GIYEGNEIIERFAHTNELGGFIQSLRAWPKPPELVGLARYAAWPSGLVTAEMFKVIMDGMHAALKKAGKVDALLLALHGAMVAECEPDMEGELLRRMRQEVGPNIPIVATLDLHTNITRKMVDNADVLVLFHTAPHIDVTSTGKRGAA